MAVPKSACCEEYTVQKVLSCHVFPSCIAEYKAAINKHQTAGASAGASSTARPVRRVAPHVRIKQASAIFRNTSSLCLEKPPTVEATRVAWYSTCKLINVFRAFVPSVNFPHEIQVPSLDHRYHPACDLGVGLGETQLTLSPLDC